MILGLGKTALLIIVCHLLLVEGSNMTIYANRYNYKYPPIVNFLDTSIRPPEGIATDPNFDQICLTRSTNTVRIVP